MKIQLNAKLKKVGDHYMVAEDGEDFCGYYAATVNETEFVIMVPAGHGTIFYSEPMELLDPGVDDV